MEKAIRIYSPAEIDKCARYDRVYFGPEFCQKKIFTLDQLKEVSSAADNAQKQLTILTPYVTNAGMDKLRILFGYINSKRPGTEVIFNDWGVFHLLRSGYKDIAPVMGRLLAKQRKDPRAFNILMNRQKPKILSSLKDRNRLISLPKKIPPSLFRHFRSSMINVPAFQSFLLENGIKRIEIDNMAWKMELKICEEIGLSLHYPYAYITTTRLCGSTSSSAASCSLLCRKKSVKLKLPPSPLPFYVRGNAIFYKISLPKNGYLSKNRINRTICSHEVPV